MDRTNQDKNIQFKSRLLRIILLILILISGLFLYLDYKTEGSISKNHIKTIEISSFFTFKGRASGMKMNKTKEKLFLTTSEGLWILSLRGEKDLEVLSVLKSKDKEFSEISTTLLSDDEKTLYLQKKSKIVVVDISNVKDPHILSSIDLGGFEIQSMNISNDQKKIYICTDEALFVSDIQNKNLLQLKKELLKTSYKNVFEVTKSLLYAFDMHSNLDILTNERGEIRILGSYSLVDIPRNFILSPEKRRLYLLNEKGIEILNIQDYKTPKPFGSFYISHLVDSAVALNNDENYLYLAQQKEYLNIVDVRYTDAIKVVARVNYGDEDLEPLSCLVSKDSKYLYILFKNTHIGIVKLAKKDGGRIYER